MEPQPYSTMARGKHCGPCLIHQLSFLKLLLHFISYSSKRVIALRPKKRDKWPQAPSNNERCLKASEVKKMGIANALQNQGYEFDEECTDREGNAEIWINRKISMGMRIEWFWLKGCYYER